MQLKANLLLINGQHPIKLRGYIAPFTFVLRFSSFVNEATR